VPETKERILEDMDRLFGKLGYNGNKEELLREEKRKGEIRKTLSIGHAPEHIITSKEPLRIDLDLYKY
jgi:hypothetical protein